jgi:2-polyprenyl-6-methoxyphenol hydroxylase-like FAD-dependent oxidoreductase
VAVQTENESEKIKTDLLVGADGVARAIRVVN